MAELSYATAGRSATMTLQSAAKLFQDPKYGGAFKGMTDDRPADELVKTYVDFIRHQPAEWLRYLPKDWKHQGLLTKAKGAILNMQKVPEIVEAVGLKIMKKMATRVKREITKAAIEQEAARRTKDSKDEDDDGDGEDDDGDDDDGEDGSVAGAEASDGHTPAGCETAKPVMDVNARIRAACIAYADAVGKHAEAAVLRALWQEPAPDTDRRTLVQIFKSMCFGDRGARTVLTH